jgi:hypothetical protein
VIVVAVVRFSADEYALVGGLAALRGETVEQCVRSQLCFAPNPVDRDAWGSLPAVRRFGEQLAALEAADGGDD